MSLRLEIDKELERMFRERAMRTYGYSKGSIKKAAESAIKTWMERKESEWKGFRRDKRLGLVISGKDLFKMLSCETRKAIKEIPEREWKKAYKEMRKKGWKRAKSLMQAY